MFVVLTFTSCTSKEESLRNYNDAEQKCYAGDKEICNNLVFAYSNLSYYNNLEYAKKLQRISVQACELGDAASCERLSSLHFNGRNGFIKDFALAKEYSLKGCELGSKHSCYTLAKIYELGCGVQANKKLSDELFEKAGFRKIGLFSTHTSCP